MKRKREVGEIDRPQKHSLNALLLENINEAIKEAKISKTDIAKRLGVTYPTLWKVLHGRLRLKPEHIAEIAYMTRRTPNDFFYAKD